MELIDTISTKLELIIDENEDSPKKWRGVFAKCDVPTANGRIYSRSLWEKIINDPKLQERLKGGMVGVLNHPHDGETDLLRATIATFGLHIEDDGSVVGEAIILPTACGETLLKLIESGVRVGVSSRGKGSVNEHGVVNEDYVLVSFDVVDNPAVSDAIPSVTESGNSTDKSKTHRRIKMSVLDSYYAIETQVSPVISAIEEGAFDENARSSLDAVLKTALAQLVGLDENENKNNLVQPIITNLQERILNARSILTKPKKVSQKSEEDELVGNDNAGTIDESDKTPQRVNIDELKNQKPSNVDSGGDDNNKAIFDDNENLDELDSASLKAYVRELEEANADLERKYKEACWAIEEFKKEVDQRGVAEAVDEAIKDNPQLKEAKDMLESAKSVEEVATMVETLKKLTKNDVEDDGAPIPPPDVSKRKFRNTGDFVVEDADTKKQSKSLPFNHRSVLMALDESTKSKSKE